MITGKNESKILTKDISYECKCKLYERNLIQIKNGITINVDVNVKTMIFVKMILFGILLHVVVKM